MSEEGLEVHMPHEHAVEHAATEHGHGLSQWVAIFTALLAALGALVSYQGGQLMDEVLLQKNDAVLQKAHATDEWNYYQAASTKQHLEEMARDLAPESRRPAIDAEIAKYKAQKIAIKARADALEAKSAEADAEAARLGRPRKDMARSLIFLQIAISLASITALTRRSWLFAAALLSATVGIWMAATAFGMIGA